MTLDLVLILRRGYMTTFQKYFASYDLKRAGGGGGGWGGGGSYKVISRQSDDQY